MSNAALELHMRGTKVTKEAKEATSKLIDITNQLGMDDTVAQGILEGLLASLPTLRQSFCRLMAKALNEHPREWAKRRLPRSNNTSQSSNFPPRHLLGHFLVTEKV